MQSSEERVKSMNLALALTIFSFNLLPHHREMVIIALATRGKFCGEGYKQCVDEGIRN